MKDNVKQDNFFEIILKIAVVSVMLVSFLMIMNMTGFFSISEKDKIEKIKSCTANKLGINISYALLNSGHINNVTCCTKFEKYCNFDNLK